jgi:cobalt transporter subunit CbtB
LPVVAALPGEAPVITHVKFRTARFASVSTLSHHVAASQLTAVSEARPQTAPDARSAAGLERVARIAPLLATLAFGVIVLFCVGFLQTPAVHNGAHDTRHANGFPCH